MNNQEVFLDKWLPTELPRVPDFIESRLGTEKVSVLLSTEINKIFKQTTDIVQAEQRFSKFKIYGTQINDYKARLIQSDLGDMITGIRFVGGDLTKPAVFIILKDFELVYAKDIQQITHLIKSEYRAFRPQRMRWFSTKDESALIEYNSFLKGDLFLISNFISDLKKQPEPEHYTELELKQTQSGSWYSKYQKEYEIIHNENPFAIEMGQAETKTKMQDLADKGLLFEAYRKNDFVGIIAVDRQRSWFLDGYVVMEELLFQPFRTQKLASAMQRHLINQLDGDLNQMLYGTIHYDNLSSLKTAYRCGRKYCGMYIFSDL